MSKTPSRQPTPEPKYTIQIDRDAEKTLRRQGRTTKERLVKAMLVLADNHGYDRLFRLRVSDWRIIHQIIDDKLLILVLEIDKRSYLV